MRFTFEGKSYGLSFEQKFKNVTAYVDGNPHVLRSTYPYTTVTLYERETLPYLNRSMAMYSVGCLPTDKFSNEEGCMQALRGLHKRIAKSSTPEFRAAMWNSYLQRDKPISTTKEVHQEDASVIEAAEVTEVKQQLALPPAAADALELWD